MNLRNQSFEIFTHKATPTLALNQSLFCIFAWLPITELFGTIQASWYPCNYKSLKIDTHCLQFYFLMGNILKSEKNKTWDFDLNDLVMQGIYGTSPAE